MQAIEITEFGGPEVLAPVARKKPEPGPGEALIRVRAAGINRPDTLQRKGLYPAPPGASDVPGLEVAGIIEKLGPEVEGLALGDAVCALVAGGGYAEYCLAPRETVLPKPEPFSFEEAAGIPETFFTVWSNVFERARFQEGETILVHGGSSGIGSTAILMVKAMGGRVIVTAGTPDKCDFCIKLGAEAAINYRDQDFVTETMSQTAGKGVDVVLDMVAGPYIERDIACMAEDGRLVIIAFLGGTQAALNLAPVMMKRLTISGSTLRARPKAFKGKIAKRLKENIWPLLEAGGCRPPVDSVFELAEAAKAHAHMEKGGHMGKIILKV
jgi:putative PIG3 family NAD(P)H quinone oxidoreductase